MITIYVIYAAIIYTYHYPWIIYNDDFTVLPEIAWFSGYSSSFLKHLLFFNQTRYTWVGDYHLFRPGLFFIYFLSHKYLISHGVIFELIYLQLVILLFFYVIWKYLSNLANNKIIGFSFAMITVFPISGFTLYMWPHIQPYIIAVGLYTYGTLLLFGTSRHTSKNVNYLAGAVLLILATFFHELAVGAIAILVFIGGVYFSIRFVRRKINKSEIDFKAWLILSGILLAYVIFRLYVFVHTNEFAIRDDETKITLQPSLNLDFFKLVFNFFSNMLNAGFHLSDKTFLGAIFFILALSLSIYNLFSLNWLALSAIAAFWSVSSLLILGRMLPRGTIATWYHPIMIFFILTVIAQFISLFTRIINSQWWSRYANSTQINWQYILNNLLSFIILVPSINYALTASAEIRRQISGYQNSNSPAFSFVKTVKADIKKHHYCYAGAAKEESPILKYEPVNALTGGIDFPNKMLTMLLMPEICRPLDPRIPKYYYYKYGAPSYSFHTNKTPLVLDLLENHPAKILFSPMTFGEKNIYQIPKIGTTDTSQTINYQHYKISKKISGLIVELTYDDVSPIMYNVIISWNLKKANKTTSVTLSTNYILALQGTGQNSKLVAVGLVPYMSPDLTMEIRKRHHVCDIFINKYLSTTIPDCAIHKGTVQIGSWNNGAPTEKLLALYGST